MLRVWTLTRGLEQLDGVSVWIFELDLLAGRPALHLVAKAKTGGLQPCNPSGKIGDFQDDAVPSARLLKTAIGHRAGAGSAWAAQQQVERSERYRGKCRELLMLQRESELLCVEVD